MSSSQRYRYQCKLSIVRNPSFPSYVPPAGVYFNFRVKYILKRRAVIGEGSGDVETVLGSIARYFFVNKHLITGYQGPEDQFRRTLGSPENFLDRYFGHHGVRDDEFKRRLIHQIEDLTEQNLNASRQQMLMILSFEVYTVQQGDELICDARNRAIIPDPEEVNRADRLTRPMNPPIDPPSPPRTRPRPGVLLPPLTKVKVQLMDELERQNEECCICLNMLVCRGEEISQLPCSHAYHSSCIIRWAWKSNRCPLCRSPLDSSK